MRLGLILGLALLVPLRRGPRCEIRRAVTRQAAPVSFASRSTASSCIVICTRSLSSPPAAAVGVELLVFLHGRGSRPDSILQQPLFAALRDLGGQAPNVLLPDGGDHSYWHDRRDGKWGTSLLREAMPAALARSHADSDRVAIGGISMGGFGALDVARLAPSRFCAVGAHSAALWFRSRNTPAGTFDDAEDFSEHDVIGFARNGRSTASRSGSMSAGTILST